MVITLHRVCRAVASALCRRAPGSRARARTPGLPVVLWLPKFWSMDGRRQTGSSLSRVLERMQSLGGPHGMYGTVFGELEKSNEENPKQINKSDRQRRRDGDYQ